jgi:phosphatidyl-myo-inositol alpha-mannosyltransferase
MKIAIVSPYDFSYPGGVVNHIKSLESHFTRMGHTVKLIAPASSSVNGYGDRFILMGKPRPVPTSGSIARITISPTLSGKVKDILEREKFDIIHLHEPLAPMLCTTVLRFSNSINVGTFHATESRPSYRWINLIMMMRLYKKWFHRLHGRICVSQPSMDYINKYFPSKFNIIPNGIDLHHFSPDVEPIPEYLDGKKNLLFVGRMEKRKGLDYLIKAYALLKPDYPDVRLIIVGPGTALRKKYERFVKKHRLEDVIFTGGVDYNTLARFYRTADIFCAPATGQESFGIILLEAMATGTPVVASAISGYSSVMTDGEEGLLVPPKQKIALAQALSRLIENTELCRKMGERGRVTAAKYGWEKISLRILDYYIELLEKYKSSVIKS